MSDKDKDQFKINDYAHEAKRDEYGDHPDDKKLPPSQRPLRLEEIFGMVAQTYQVQALISSQAFVDERTRKFIDVFVAGVRQFALRDLIHWKVLASKQPSLIILRTGESGDPYVVPPPEDAISDLDEEMGEMNTEYWKDAPGSRKIMEDFLSSLRDLDPPPDSAETKGGTEPGG